VRATFTQYSVPGWGVGELWTDDEVVLAHDFAFAKDAEAAKTAAAGMRAGSDARPPKGAASPPTGTLAPKSARVDSESAPNGRLDPERLVDRFNAFLAGREVSLADVPLDLDWATPFQLAVANALREIARGEVVSYGELAALAGYPGAGRAVGTFCARNRFMLLLPCHRVVGAAGIGGYGSAGVGVKRRLLALEGVSL
jgi:O-6-methylguanine DNA methyltransferase